MVKYLVASAVLVLAGCTSGGAVGHSPSPSGWWSFDSAVRSGITTPPGTATPPNTSQPSAGPRTVTVLGTGDVLIHPQLIDQARADGGGSLNFQPMLASVAPDVRRADLAICELETPLAP